MSNKKEIMGIHSAAWFEKMNRTIPWFTFMAAKSIDSNDGDKTGCTVCGDMPAKPCVLVNLRVNDEEVPAVLLCDDCKDIQRDVHNHIFQEIKEGYHA